MTGLGPGRRNHHTIGRILPYGHWPLLSRWTRRTHCRSVRHPYRAQTPKTRGSSHAAQASSDGAYSFHLLTVLLHLILTVPVCAAHRVACKLLMCARNSLPVVAMVANCHAASCCTSASESTLRDATSGVSVPLDLHSSSTAFHCASSHRFCSTNGSNVTLPNMASARALGVPTRVSNGGSTAAAARPGSGIDGS